MVLVTSCQWIKEHAYKDKESAVNKRLNSCYDTTYLDAKSNKERTEFVLTNTKIIDSFKKLEFATLQGNTAHLKMQTHVK